MPDLKPQFERARTIAQAGISEGLDVLARQVDKDLAPHVTQSTLSDENGHFSMADVPPDSVLFAQYHTNKDYVAWKLPVPADGSKIMMTNANVLDSVSVEDPETYVDTFKFGGSSKVIEIRGKGFDELKAWTNELQ